MKSEEISLRSKIIKAMKLQGFLVNPHLRVITNNKHMIRKVHKKRRNEVMRKHQKFLLRNLKNVEDHSINGDEIDPHKIDLDLIEVKPRSLNSKIFFWWNLIWWSLPYAKPIGRQMRFILWDRCHNAPFGLIGLQSPPLRSSVRDSFLGLTSDNVDYWINQSMYAQRVGALPPYNDLLGAKMVALSLTSNEIRDTYTGKYREKKTLLEKRILPNRLLFVTTTSAFGKSSVYERIRYRGEVVSQFIGFTAGSGTFHIPEKLYEEILSFLEIEGIDVKRGYGTGPSRKLKLINLGLRKLDIGSFSFHNIKRGYYMFSNIINLNEVIHENESPRWFDRPFEELQEFWKTRWCIPRSNRKRNWKEFDSSKYFQDITRQISG